MENRTMLRLSETKSAEIAHIGTLGRAGQIVIELEDDRPLSEIAGMFEGREELVRTDTIRPEIATRYEGYTELIDIRRNQTSGSVRLTLKKP